MAAKAGAKKITLMWRAKTERGWRYFPAIVERHPQGGYQARHGWVVENGQTVEYPKGSYYLRSYVTVNGTGRKVHEPLPTCNPTHAVLALQRAQRLSNEAGRVKSAVHLLKTASAAYIKDCKQRGALEAAEQAKLTLDEFIHGSKVSGWKGCPVGYVRSIERGHILAFHDSLRKRGMSERTIHNRHERLRAFLRWCNMDVKTVMPPAPKFEEALPEIYQPSELSAILKAADGYMGMAIRMALQLGLREQELMYAEWADVDFHHAAFRVQGKPARGFAVKDSEQREVPIPTELLERLKEWQKDHAKGGLILGTASGEPNTHLLRTLKRLANRAGLSCGKCKGCKKTGECEQWYLHKFRATYLTTLLRSGLDARTVQAFAGHSDLNTTLRYLKPASASEMQTAINAVKWMDASN